MRMNIVFVVVLCFFLFSACATGVPQLVVNDYTTHLEAPAVPPSDGVPQYRFPQPHVFTSGAAEEPGFIFVNRGRLSIVATFNGQEQFRLDPGDASGNFYAPPEKDHYIRWRGEQSTALQGVLYTDECIRRLRLRVGDGLVVVHLR